MKITISLTEADLDLMDALPPMPGQGYDFPEGTEIQFPNGEVWGRYGGYNAAGVSIDYTPDGRGETNSPCHRALRLAGLIPPDPEVSIVGIDTSMPSAWELAEED